MMADRYMEYAELEEIRKDYGNRISKFSEVRAVLLEWYQAFHLKYPDSCVNNFRDSWFHYRKIWEERSYREITVQTATFDEHLQRAEKDAVVYFFQIIAQALEFWYLIEKIEVPEAIILDFENTIAFDEYSITLNNREWLTDIWRRNSEDEVRASFFLIYGVQKAIPQLGIDRGEFQRILHNIKNKLLKIRMGSSDIHRIDGPGEYVEMGRECYEEVAIFLNYPVYLHLYGMTNVIKTNLRRYYLEVEREKEAK